jgi:hypothetical protein
MDVCEAGWIYLGGAEEKDIIVLTWIRVLRWIGEMGHAC